MPERPFYQPGASSVEGLPLALQMFHNHPLVMLKPHWHAQVEVNFIVQGSVHYRMAEHEISLSAGEMCLFWGGLPHQMDDLTDDAVYAGAHLPLVHFFRLHLPADVRHRLMTGATLVTNATDQSDNDNFKRWNDYARSGDPARTEHAVNELLLRLERVRFEPYRLVPGTAAGHGAGSPFDQQSSRNVGRMCDFIAENFLYDIDCVNIACAADIHPKYAMSLFKKSTGMTLNEYVSLLRLSYAQALLMHEDANVLKVAMDSGFGSLSAFNKSFRKLAGMSPSDFRRAGAAR
ncbi:helix-turn-helix domain-containing protein [Mesorhizobium sp. M2A.F.Ca.ET.037.01.1.1]|uniref:helix-turn-helix domain-containing protein n=1 Tax=unclassified Mesorhizobium TaxID=325217 RepID=UPI000F74E2D9|nr:MULTISPECIES: helix-turn-helix domain-containing protein [unclassified Mesorhizobium]RUY05070.1 helix-turn-helix domain-containing protein [Mesorhizobium sp. M2A.F.Ca.ET.040.01.1.1]RVC68758.1 helix-turn-helix domain-containing protein [Mesorhizobium sp. M00.F.Ca.ET.038.03.1.1]RVC79525.1 helix-turn-helix domain-containing protein [Mesorhizobium sp. M2A.F.Ca.ET.046.02.1.1]AZO35629.1 helix-turn-helix domain-containing protein [Mesorhizobium sp. M2A.F.Ca.ET.046.03.2.1]RUX23286.1 helix-turn-heli